MAASQSAVALASHGSASSPSSGSSRDKDDNKGGNIKLVYLQCYFVTIATILGSGILGLPVTMYRAGLYPFLVSFLGGFVVQALLVLFFTDILQKAYAAQLLTAKELATEHMPLNTMDNDEDFEDIEEEHESNGPVLAGHVIIPKDINVKPPNLHLIGELFLSCGVQQMFDIVLLVQFIALLISYALAGSEAYAQLIGVPHFYVIPFFVWVLTLAIVFALSIIQPIVSLLTIVKGSLLLATVAVTFFVGAAVHLEIHNDFKYIGQPFLMGTVALGGVVNVMPFLYSKIAPVQQQVRGFRLSIAMGLATCVVLNILWCWAVLDIVPQRKTCHMYVEVNNASSIPTVPSVHTDSMTCNNLSLESASENGEISTLPLTKIIHSLYPAYDWVAIVVELFIMISITVSYLINGAAMHHTLCGWVDSVWAKDKLSSYSNRIQVSTRCQCCNTVKVCQSVLSLVAFTIVFGVAMLNPKGFVYMLEKATSFFINVEYGLFVFLMINRGSNKENRRLKIPVPIPYWAFYLIYLFPLYFGFAVGYDVFTSVYDLIHGHLKDPNLVLHLQSNATLGT